MCCECTVNCYMWYSVIMFPSGLYPRGLQVDYRACCTFNFMLRRDLEIYLHVTFHMIVIRTGYWSLQMLPAECMYTAQHTKRSDNSQLQNHLNVQKLYILWNPQRDCGPASGEYPPTVWRENVIFTSHKFSVSHNLRTWKIACVLSILVFFIFPTIHATRFCTHIVTRRCSFIP